MSNQKIDHVCGVVICGGKSTRMGMDKASLNFDGKTMLDRVTGILAQVFESIVVVAAQDQKIPELSNDTLVTRDQVKDYGPLEGIRAGLASLPRGCNAAYVSSCDVPLLQVDFVRMMVEQLGEFDIAVPEAGGFKHPLAAVYRKNVIEPINVLIESNRLRPVFLFESLQTNIVQQQVLESVDPHLYSLLNLNSPADLLHALEIARGHSN